MTKGGDEVPQSRYPGAMIEAEFIAALRRLPLHPGALGLADDGARPEGVLLNHPLGADEWDRAFLAGLAAALAAFDCALLGGDTVSLPAGAPRVLTLTAIGADAMAPARSGAVPGDDLWVTGTIGDAGAGLAIARGAAGPRSEE